MSPLTVIKCPSTIFATVQFAAIVLSLGCGQTKNDSAQFIPTSEAAESAVKASMEAWLKGESSGTIAGTNPVVQFIESHHRGGQSLVKYEILGEVAGNSARSFAVHAFVKAQKDDAEKLLRLKFVVMGRDPLFVWGQDDYEMFSHWDHKMKDPASPEAPKE